MLNFKWHNSHFIFKQYCCPAVVPTLSSVDTVQCQPRQAARWTEQVWNTQCNVKFPGLMSSRYGLHIYTWLISVPIP